MYFYIRLSIFKYIIMELYKSTFADKSNKLNKFFINCSNPSDKAKYFNLTELLYKSSNL